MYQQLRVHTGTRGQASLCQWGGAGGVLRKSMEEDTGTWELGGLSERGESGGRRSQAWKEGIRDSANKGRGDNTGG